MTTRPFLPGERVHWRAPDVLADRLIAQGLPVEDTCEIVGEPLVQAGVDAIHVTATYSRSGQAICPIAWLTHIDVPARTPDKACRWCHGTGAVLLVFSHAPCECVGP